MGNTNSGLQTDRFAQQVLLPKHQVFRDEKKNIFHRTFTKGKIMKTVRLNHLPVAHQASLLAGQAGPQTLVQLEQKAYSDHRP